MSRPGSNLRLAMLVAPAGAAFLASGLPTCGQQPQPSTGVGADFLANFSRCPSLTALLAPIGLTFVLASLVGFMSTSYADIITYHNDAQRTGWNATEQTLTPANVGSSEFGLLRTVVLDDQVDAQPLVVNQQTIKDRGTNPHGFKTQSNVFVAADGYMYFRGTDDKVWRVKTDGTDSSNPGGFKTHSDVLVAADGYMYFRGTDDKVWRVKCRRRRLHVFPRDRRQGLAGEDRRERRQQSPRLQDAVRCACRCRRLHVFPRDRRQGLAGEDRRNRR